MATVQVDEMNIRQLIDRPGITLLEFWASWCGPCRFFGPIFDRASELHPDIVFGKVDTEDQQGIAQGFGISSIPTLMVFRDGVLLFAEAGALPDAGLESLIKQIRALDMEQIRRELEERAPALAEG